MSRHFSAIPHCSWGAGHRKKYTPRNQCRYHSLQLIDNKRYGGEGGIRTLGTGVSPYNVGRYAVTHDEADRGRFKTPSLRNLALTAPYMHDGSLKDLKQVLDFYIGGGNSHPNLDKEIRPLDFLTGQERRDLLAFLNSLNGELPTN